MATRERDNTSLLIHLQNEKIMVDCPGSVVQKIKKIGGNPLDIHSVLVTHIHPDHIYGLPSFIHSMMLDEKRINLYGSEETIRFCRNLLDLFRLRDKKIKIRVNFHPASPSRHFQLTEKVEVVPLRVPHHSSSLAFHFYFRDENKELVYSGDTPSHPPLFEEAKDADYLIHDSSCPSRFFEQHPFLYRVHTPSLELGKFSQKAGVRCLIPCHFFGEVEFPLSEIEEEIMRYYKGKLIIPKDLEKLRL